MIVRSVAIGILILTGVPALACPWQDYPYGGPNGSDTTGTQTTPGGNYVYAFPPALPRSTTGAIGNISVNPMPVSSDEFSLGFGGNGYSLYTGTYAWNAPKSILPPTATSSMVGLSVAEDPSPDQVGGFGFGFGVEVEAEIGIGGGGVSGGVSVGVGTGP